MENSNMYPKLNQLLPLERIPNELEAIKEVLASVLDSIFVKNLIVGKSYEGDAGYYTLDLVTDSLGVDIPFVDDLRLVFNPTNTGATEIPIQFDYSWLIIKYIKDFSASSFDNAVESVFHILLDLAGTDSKTLLKDAILAFYSEATFLSDFINDFNTKYNQNLTASTSNNLSDLEKIELLSDEIYELDLDVIQVIYDSFINISVDEGLQKLEELFIGYFENIQETIKEIIQLNFNLSIDEISLGLQFPHKWLRPVDENTLEVLPDTYYSVFSFNAGRLIYSSKNGFDFVNTSSFNLNTSVIGKTGLVIGFSDLKVDLEKNSNIPEADADGRPDDFKGVYAKKATISLPARWFKEVDNTTLSIVANDMLIGTGGVSGTIELQAIDGTPNNGLDYLDTNLGGWLVGFNRFDIQFKQNAVIESNIVGKLTIPKLKDSAGNIADIEISGHLNEEGDFNLTAYEKDGFKEFNLFNFVNFNLLSLELGKEDDKFYIGTSCEIWFDNPIMKKVLRNQRITIPRLRIYEDGSMEIVGGNGFIPVSIPLDLGPIEIAITGIHFGSIQQEFNGKMRKYNYWGFDGAISLDPLGLDARGEGIKYYYTVDNDEKDENGNLLFPEGGDSFLRIQTIEVDLIIPGTANPDAALAIINGMLSIPEPGESQEYEGKISLKLPKARISGGAHMKLQPKEPAFILEAELGLSTPISLAATGLAFYSFGGILGYKYVAEKEAIPGFTSENTWYEYYKYPKRGVNLDKFSGPPKTNDYSVPVALGAGTVLGTIFDDGFTFSTRLMAILSLPSVFILDGRANILGERLGILDDTEPPFFAFVAVGDSSFEFAIGADYSLPSNGWILDLYAEVQAGFFANNPSGWYLNFGTRQKPIKAEVLTILSARAYLMLSARGMQMGARAELDLKKSFAGIKIHLNAYVEVGAHISFERLQLGGYVAIGGAIDIDIWRIFSLYLKLDVIAAAEAAKPFLLYFEFRLKVCIRLFWFLKICVRVTIPLKWELSKHVDRTPIPALPNDESTYIDRTLESVKGIHMLTGETFDLKYTKTLPNPNTINKIIPLDTFIDIKTMKGLSPVSVRDKIGGHTGMAENFIDLIPPNKVVRGGRQIRQVKHKYSIEKIEIKMWNGSSWVNYHPFEAVVPVSDRELVNNLPIGYWQRTGKQYDAIRILGTSPFSYMTAGEPGWFIPEQYGITPSELFCVSEGLKNDCVNFLNKEIGTKYYRPNGFIAHNINGAYFTLDGIDVEPEFLGSSNDEEQIVTTNENRSYLEINNQENNFDLEKSLEFKNSESLAIILPTPAREVTLKLTTFAEGITITYFKTDENSSVLKQEYTEVESIFKTKNQTKFPVKYESENALISKIIITPSIPNIERINEIREEIAQLYESTYDGADGEVSVIEPEDIATYEALLEELKTLTSTSCTTIPENELNLGPKVLCEIYNEVNTDGFDEYRFRVYNESCKIVLSSNFSFNIQSEAIEGAQQVLEQINTNTHSFKIEQTTGGEYYFNVVDGNNNIIARRIEYFTLLNDCLLEINKVKELCKEKELLFTDVDCETFKTTPSNILEITKTEEVPIYFQEFNDATELDNWSFTYVSPTIVNGEMTLDSLNTNIESERFLGTISQEVKKVRLKVDLTAYKEEENTSLSYIAFFKLLDQNGNILENLKLDKNNVEEGKVKSLNFVKDINIPNGVMSLTLVITQPSVWGLLASYDTIGVYELKETIVNETNITKFINKYEKENTTRDYHDSLETKEAIYTVGVILESGSPAKGLVTKLDKKGNIIWEKTYETTSTSGLRFSRLVICDNSDILIKGTSRKIQGDISITVNSITRIDAEGNIIWRKYYHVDGINSFHLTKIKGEEYVIFMDVFQSSGGGNYLLKIDGNGNILKQKKITSFSSVPYYSPITSNGENIVVIGAFGQIIELDLELNYIKGINLSSAEYFEQGEYLNNELIVSGISYEEDLVQFFKIDLKNVDNQNFNVDFKVFSGGGRPIFSSGGDRIYWFYSKLNEDNRTHYTYINCLSKDLNLLYSKGFNNYNNGAIEISQVNQNTVLFNDYNEGITGLLGLDFDSCKTELLPKRTVTTKTLEFNTEKTVTIDSSNIPPENGSTNVSSIISTKKEICSFNTPPDNQNPITICNTSLQEVCWLTQEKWEYNQTIPGQAAMEAEQANMEAAVENVVQPIWRPNTAYHLHFQLKDEVDNGKNSKLFNYYYSFKTVGPVGHFHKHAEVSYLPENANPDNYPITSLRQYIDYNRSYPNANGNLLQAKPLFYGAKQAKLSLFFSQPLTQNMFKLWEEYNGLSELEGNIHLAIKDPVSEQIIPYPLPVDYNTEEIPLPEGNGEGGVPWVSDNDPRIPLNIRTLNNWIEYINDNFDAIKCELKIGDAIQPQSYAYSVTLTNLKPSKLYTALVYNAFEVNSDDNLTSEKVHEYVFQTSRYKNFEEQVTSFRLTDTEGNTSEAIFTIDLPLTDTELNELTNIVTSGSTDEQSFDKLIENTIGLNPLDPPVGTEFNLIRNSNTNNVVAILIRNPEPFNNPKIPIEIAKDMIRVNNGEEAYNILYSKDYANVIITHSSNTIAAQSLEFQFQYYAWNGKEYIVEDTVNVENIVLKNN
ncbi:hypothetical protein [Tenacibaculum larymnensis]|uniref:Uncharacterized protein n=1 Tax=Tenacibaculum larymnensis TaxID=2878201 RepID=A0A9X4EKM5_9FLAO|nr:hypothetical protein [Tenacibaculum larymnensis]MDE1205558.1 hypothetical protein [Tenacibaculum larymnensis]